MTTHTPGPWTYHRDEGTITRYTIAAVCIGRDRTGQTVPFEAELIADTRGSNDEAHANARLIAAAPEMLAALRAFVATVEWHEKNYGNFHEDMTDAKIEVRALLARIEA